MGVKIRDIDVGNLIGEAEKFKIYLGKTEDDQEVIVKVAKTFEDGDILAKEAGKFKLLDSFEAHIKRLEEDKGLSTSHYDWLFGRLHSSFTESTQGDRRINVFKIPDIELSKLIPLSKLSAESEIDCRTSVWILGRLLKFYAFHELLGEWEYRSIPRYPVFSPDDYLIGPDSHRLIYYNFSEDIQDVIATAFVKSIANFMIKWVVIEDDSPETDYMDLLKDFSENGRQTFEKAHKDLYSLVKELWGVRYHPFTYRERNSLIWKTIKED